MDFGEALDELRSGKKIRRKEWESSVYIEQIDNDILCFRREAVPFTYDMSIINSDNWEILGDECTWSFSDALNALSENYKIRLTGWPEDCYLERTAGKKEVFMRRNTVYPFVPTFECFMSDDWVTI